MNYLHNFIYGVYPYLALAVFLLGSLLRFDREQYTWKSDSSQLLAKAGMRVGSNLFHVGILCIFAGHFFGLLMPHGVFLALGISDMAHQMIAIWAGSIFGLLCLIGGAMLWVRRMFNTRILVTSHGSDKFILSWLLVTLILGLCTIPTSIGHANEGNASVVIALTQWVQSVAFLHPNPALLADVDTIFKVHIFFGLTVFLLFPFTRLVHIWSGFASVSYLFRPYQLVRLRRR